MTAVEITVEPALRPRRVGVGDTIHVDGRPARIATADPDSGPDIFILASEGGAVAVSPNELVFNPRISIPGVGTKDGPAPPVGAKLLTPSLRTFARLVGDDAMEKAQALAWHINECETGYKDRRNYLGVTPDPRYDLSLVPGQATRERAKVAELKGTPLEVALPMLRKLRTKYKKSGYDPCSLVSGYLIRRRSSTDIRDAMVAIMREHVALRISKSKVTRLVAGTEAWLEVKKLPGFASAERPIPRTINRWIKEDPVLDAYFRRAADTNRSDALKPEESNQFFSAPATRPGQYIQIDTWEVPVRALGSDGKPMNVRLVLAVDVYTRIPLAWRFVPMAEKSVDIALLLAHMLTPEPMRPDWEDTARFHYLNLPIKPLCDLDERLRWASVKPIIMPECIFMDNGKPYDSIHFRLACERLGISIQPSRVMHPTDKAIVENTFLALQTLWAQVLNGYKGGNVRDRGANPDLDAFFTPEHFDEMFTEFIITAWMNRIHRGLAGVPEFPGDDVTPLRMYELGVMASGFIYYPLSLTTYLDLLPVHVCAINDKTITIETRKYRGPVLAALTKRSPYTEWSGKWPIAQDPQNITRAFVKHPETNDWHVLEWEYAQAYGAPMSDYRWRMARSLAAADRGGRRPLDSMDVVQKAIEIRDRCISRALMTEQEASRERALDDERTRMAVHIPTGFDGVVRTDDGGETASNVLNPDIWDAEPAAYPDDLYREVLP